MSKALSRYFPERNIPKILLRLFLYSTLVISVCALLLVLLVRIGVFGHIPSKKELAEINNPLASEVYSADSVLLGRYFVQERSFLKPDEIPKSLKSALVATEDVRFYQHNGVDVRSLFRVFVKSILLQHEASGGGSTLTQQLAKNLFPRKTYGILSLPVNKTREILIARKLESVYSKDELIVLYLNTIPFADNTYGVKTAADRFFSSPVRSLSWGQSATLVGMLKATHHYNPRLFPERALQRRNVVLAQLAKYEYISQHEKDDLQARPLGLKYNYTVKSAGLAPYFRAFIQQQLIDWCRENIKGDGSPYNLFKDGLKIYTTIDSRLQRYAEQAMASHMRILQAQFTGQIGKRQLEKITLEKIMRSRHYRQLTNEGLGEGEIIARLKQSVRTRIFTWDGEKETDISIYDSIRHHIQFLQSGVLAMNPSTGEVLAYVGGINHQYFPFDHVRETTKRQIGSTFKPIVYAAALERGIGPCSYISGRKAVYTNMDDWAPRNTDAETYNKKYSMTGGLAGSVNTVSVKLIEKTGIYNAIDVARKMGITSDLPAVPSIALGTPSISVTEMVTAYSVFANGGYHVSPGYITRITDRNGRLLAEFSGHGKKKRALSRETTQMMIHMLQSVVSGGTGASLRSRYAVQNDVAGKTGTTQSNVDGWFISVSPGLVVGVWVGADDPRMHFRSTALGQGSATALPIVGKVYQQANKDPHLRKLMFARFEPLPEHLEQRLDCAPSKSNLNIFERIFKKKKKTKVTKFRSRRDKS